MAANLKAIEETEAYTALAMKGSLDMAGAWEIERALLDYVAMDVRHLLIDISAVDFLGSMGIRVFVRSASALLRKQKKLVLFAPQAPVERTLTVSGFTSAIPVVRSLEDAIAVIAT